MALLILEHFAKRQEDGISEWHLPSLNIELANTALLSESARLHWDIKTFHFSSAEDGARPDCRAVEREDARNHAALGRSTAERAGASAGQQQQQLVAACDVDRHIV